MTEHSRHRAGQRIAERSRREFLGGLAALPLLAATRIVAEQRAGSHPAMRLIMLGTAGGPRPKRDRSAPAQAIVLGDALWVIDCGNGVARQVVRAGLDLPSLRRVFITHQHSDHNADYGNLIWLAWASGLKTAVDTYGPPPLERMTRLFFEMNAYDIETRVHDEGRPALEPLVHAHELEQAGSVVNDGTISVTAALVNHPSVVPAFAYRFDGPGRSIVISGDTTRSEALITLARGADVLVHEALYPAAMERMVAEVPNASRLREHILASHTPVEDVGRVAEAAGVKTLVLTHLVPADDPNVTDEMWLRAASMHFRGRVIVASDLLEV